MNKVLLIICISVFVVLSTKGQQLVTSSAGQVNSSNYSLNYSIGQLFYQTHKNESYNIIEGINQNYSITVLSNKIRNKIDVKIYPNPTKRFLFIETTDEFSIRILDSIGKVIYTNHVSEIETKIDLEHYNGNIFFIRIFDKSGKNNLYKVLKTQ